MHDVFISYSTRERTQAYAIRAFLTERGITCWMAPESIPTGSNYTKEIPVAIRNCQVFLLILSENAQKSPWVLRELDGAVNNSKYVLPYLLDDTPMEDEFQFLLTGCQWHPSWQENALESLAERIHSLLPPKEAPQPEPLPEPEPEAAIPAPKPQTPPPPEPEASRQAVFCPACRSRNTEPLKKDRRSYLPGESARFVLAWLAGVVAFLPAWGILSPFLQYIDPLVDFRSQYSARFNELGDTVNMLLALLASVGVGILCHRRIRKWIRHSRVQQGFRASGLRCRDCCKKFRVTTPVMTRFPWEKPMAPIVPMPDIAVVRCPSCGTETVTPRKQGEGSWDRKEKWYFLPAWLAGIAAFFPLIALFYEALKHIPFLLSYRSLYYVEFNDLGLFLILVCALAAAYGVVRLVRIPLREPIRRRRVRGHVRAWGFRCPDCGIDFRLVIPLSHRFPHELSAPAGNSGLRQGRHT